MRHQMLAIVAGSVLGLGGFTAAASGQEGVAPTVPAVAGSVDEAAKAALMAASEAIMNLPPVTFTAKSQTGGSGLNIAGTVKVKLIRGRNGLGSSYQLDGKYAAPGLARDTKPDGKDADFTTVLGASIEDKFVQWLQAKDETRKDKDGKDVLIYKAKTLVERPIKSAEPGISKATLASETFKEVFLNTNPFAQELGSPSITLDKPQTIGGEDCIVIRATTNQGKIERIITISAIDKLPRRYEQGVMNDGKRVMTRTFEFSDYNMDKSFGVEDLKLKMPAGYTLDRKTEADLPKPAAAAPTPVPAKQADNLMARQDMADDLRGRIKELQKILSDPGLTPEDRTKLEGELTEVRAKYAQIAQDRKGQKGKPDDGSEKVEGGDDKGQPGGK